ncbi:MAG: bifunctional hydroxymethylpyrimidine kinase/phosphomethylpyrimidine kinase, partial [Candidatus Saccharicenans sp.]
MRKVLLTIAGFDPSSGAGASLDLKVFSHFGYYGLAVLTSVTIQNSYKVYDYLTLPTWFVRQEYKKLITDFNLSGIKIGMLGQGKIISVIKEIVSENKERPLVVDPVFCSSSGHWLLPEKDIDRYLKAIRGKITLITPNLFEAGLIIGEKITSLREMQEAARKISDRTLSACLVKGGHLKEKAVDVLYDGQKIHNLKKKKLSFEVHGTGCFLSSAILCFLATGLPVAEAC